MKNQIGDKRSFNQVPDTGLVMASLALPEKAQGSRARGLREAGKLVLSEDGCFAAMIIPYGNGIYHYHHSASRAGGVPIELGPGKTQIIRVTEQYTDLLHVLRQGEGQPSQRHRILLDPHGHLVHADEDPESKRTGPGKRFMRRAYHLDWLGEPATVRYDAREGGWGCVIEHPLLRHTLSGIIIKAVNSPDKDSVGLLMEPSQQDWIKLREGEVGYRKFLLVREPSQVELAMVLRPDCARALAEESVEVVFSGRFKLNQIRWSDDGNPCLDVTEICKVGVFDEETVERHKIVTANQDLIVPAGVKVKEVKPLPGLTGIAFVEQVGKQCRLKFTEDGLARTTDATLLAVADDIWHIQCPAAGQLLVSIILGDIIVTKTIWLN